VIRTETSLKPVSYFPGPPLLFLFGQLDFENYIHISQQDIASGLGMQTSHVSRAMKLLTKKQIILEGQKNGRIKCYRLNPNYGWKGKVKNLEEHRREQFKVIQGGIGSPAPSDAENAQTSQSNESI
jgi:hypothetical protein